jgi:hypothetical protein
MVSLVLALAAAFPLLCFLQSFSSQQLSPSRLVLAGLGYQGQPLSSIPADSLGPDVEMSNPLNHSAPFESWLKFHFPDKQQPLSLALAFGDQIGSSLKQARASFTRFGTAGGFFVVCADAACLKTCEQLEIKAYGGFAGASPSSDFSSYIHVLGPIRFRSSIAILEAGYSFLFFDLDVYFLSNPFVGFSELLVDLYFQAEQGGINVGFYFASPNARSIAFFKECLYRAEVPGSWEQRIVNELLEDRNYTANVGVQIQRLPSQTYALLTDTSAATSELASRSWRWSDMAIFHMICVERSAQKDWMARQFGLWEDVDGYYSRPKKLLTYEPWSYKSFTVAEFETDMRVLVQLANATGRYVLPPIILNVKSGEIEIPQLFNRVFKVSSFGQAPILEPNWRKRRAVVIGHSDTSSIAEERVRLTAELASLSFVESVSLLKGLGGHDLVAITNVPAVLHPGDGQFSSWICPRVGFEYAQCNQWCE